MSDEGVQSDACVLAGSLRGAEPLVLERYWTGYTIESRSICIYTELFYYSHFYNLQFSLSSESEGCAHVFLIAVKTYKTVCPLWC